MPEPAGWPASSCIGVVKACAAAWPRHLSPTPCARDGTGASGDVAGVVRDDLKKPTENRVRVLAVKCAGEPHGYWLSGEGHHPDQFAVLCYYHHRQDGEWARRFKSIARLWVDCVDLDDDALAGRIRVDGIDILVVL